MGRILRMRASDKDQCNRCARGCRDADSTDPDSCGDGYEKLKIMRISAISMFCEMCVKWHGYQMAACFLSSDALAPDSDWQGVTIVPVAPDVVSIEVRLQRF